MKTYTHSMSLSLLVPGLSSSREIVHSSVTGRGLRATAGGTGK